MVAPLALIVPAGVIGLGLVGLRLRAMSLKKSSSALSPQQQVIVAKPLPPAAAAVLAGPGPQPSTAAINSLKIMLDAGTIKLDDVMKTTTGQIVSKTAPPGNVPGQPPPDSILSQIQQGDTLVVQTAFAGPSLAGFAAGGLDFMSFVAKGPANMAERTIVGTVSDPRAPASVGQDFTLALNAITGIGPA